MTTPSILCSPECITCKAFLGDIVIDYVDKVVEAQENGKTDLDLESSLYSMGSIPQYFHVVHRQSPVLIVETKLS